MTFALASLGSLGDLGGRSAYTVALSRSPAANALVLVGVLVNDTAGTPVEPTGVIGANMVFSLVTSSITYSPTGASQIRNLSVWRSASPTPDGSMVTVTFPNAGNACLALVTEATGVLPSGTSGADAVGKSATSVNDNLSNLTIIGPSATSTANAWFVVAGVDASAPNSASDNYVALDGIGIGDPDFSAINSAWTTLSTGTIVGISGAGIRDRAGILVELVFDPDAPTASAGWCVGMATHTPRTFAPRTRGDLWVLPGDVRSLDPALDTWEGEAT